MFNIPNLPIYREKEVISNIQKLIHVMKEKSKPIFFIQHDGHKGSVLEKGSSEWEIYYNLPRNEKDKIINKTTPNPFQNTNLQNILENFGIDNLIICGLQTDYCVDTTCRQAKALEYNVTLVKDAHSTFDNGILKAEQIILHHNYILEQWFVTLKSTSEIIFKDAPK